MAVDGFMGDPYFSGKSAVGTAAGDVEDGAQEERAATLTAKSTRQRV